MEEKNNISKDNKIVLENRKKGIFSGIDKVESVNLNQIVLITNNQNLVVLGANLHIDKLDVLLGHVEISGTIDCIKYSDKKQNIFKRIFK